MSKPSLIAGIKEWVAANPQQFHERARVETLDVAGVLERSDLIDTDLSDKALATAALLFPRDHQVPLFRFFCDVRSWRHDRTASQADTPHRVPRIVQPSTTEHTPKPEPVQATPSTFTAAALQNAPQPEPAIATPSTFTAAALQNATHPEPAAASRQTKSSRKVEPVFIDLKDRPASPPESVAYPANDAVHHRLQCPHTPAELAAMAPARADVAALEFDIRSAHSWAIAIDIARQISRSAGVASWTVEEDQANRCANLWFQSTPTASPTVQATFAHFETADGPVISFRIVDIKSPNALLRAVFGDPGYAHHARVFARKLAWGLLPANQPQTI